MKQIVALFIALFFTCLWLPAQTNQEVDYTLNKIERYQKDAKSLVYFVPLEIGEITPTGWLYQWANRAAKGITGHLDEYQDVFKNGWKGFGFKAWGTNPEDGTGWPIEQCSYWLDGATKLAYILHDKDLIKKTNDRLNLVVNGVLNGAETFIYWRPKNIIHTYFNNWGHGLMGRALVSYYQATHDPKILQALVKVYSNYHFNVPTQADIDTLNNGMNNFRGATNIDAMTETYLMSGNKAIIDTIVSFTQKTNVKGVINSFADLKAGKYTKEVESAHGVSFYETLRVPAMMSLWTGDKSLFNTSKSFLSWGEKMNELPYGVCSSEEYLAGIGSFRCTETCNVPTSMWTFLWMLRLTGSRDWCDKIENVFFNAGPVPVERDFKTMCYYQSPNRYSATLPEPPRIPGKEDLKYTPYGYKVLCCVGNVNNTLPDYITNMWMATMDKGLACMLYGPCQVKKNINGTNVQINCATNYPFEDHINMSFTVSKPLSIPVYFRIPKWCEKSFSIRINNKIVRISESKNGFAVVNRIWKNKDKVVITLPMKANIQQQYETSYPQIKYFKTVSAAADTCVHNPFEYVTYGPLLFSFPIKDANANHTLSSIPYNYALNISKSNLLKDIKVVRKPFAKDWDWQIDDSPIRLIVKAKVFDWSPTQVQPLPAELISDGQDTTIQLIPYNCTKFRVTMFPVTKQTWFKK